MATTEKVIEAAGKAADKVVDGAKELAMNDKLQNAVAGMINKSIAAFEAGADFLSEQIPDVLHQLLLWHALRSGVECLFGVLLLIGFIVADVIVGKAVHKESMADTYDKGMAFVLGYLLLGSFVRLGYVAICFHFINLTWLQIWVAPKVWLIEYAAKLVK
jgi:hypothetical protein